MLFAWNMGATVEPVLVVACLEKSTLEIPQVINLYTFHLCKRATSLF